MQTASFIAVVTCASAALFALTACVHEPIGHEMSVRDDSAPQAHEPEQETAHETAHETAQESTPPQLGANSSAGASGDVAPAAPVVVRPFPGIVVRPAERTVEIDAIVCLNGGWLEQIACSPDSREHESLMVVEAMPSHVHAALLMAGCEAGAPGRWTYRDETLEFVEPRGTALDVLVRYARDGTTVEHPVSEWIRDHLGNGAFPSHPWIFGGSRFEVDGDGREHYIADLSGSLIGLVTFGDEVVGFSRVLADDATLEPQEWEVDTTRVPPIATAATIILRPAP